MAKKRGRPPLSPSPFSSKQSQLKEDKGDHPLFDISQLDKEDLSIIDSLSPKQVENLLQNLDVIREKITGKGSVETLIIENESNSQEDAGSMMFQICRKLQLLKAPLRNLNSQHFAYIDKKEADIRDRLDLVQKELIQQPDDIALQKTES
ncbi:hypothetical protein RIF29_15564 [Crotalaria pallida]|uniref:Uncharacterized protein n=1 Tax=Crotalaria pallida TaxID=3830 RepID=A0AAN9FM17_CROPI